MDKKEVYFTILVVLMIAFSIPSIMRLSGWASSFGSVEFQILAKVVPPGNFSILVNDTNGNAILNWSEVINVDGYKIWYSENVTEILQIINETNWSLAPSADITLTDNTTVEWIDTSANSSLQKYYVVAAYADTRMRASNPIVGKYDIAINDETDISHTFFGFVLERNASVDEIGIPNDFCWILTVDETQNDTWTYAYSLNNDWKGLVDEIEFGRGYYLNDFSVKDNLTNFGPVPTGNVTQLIHDETNIQQTALGWQSITTNESVDLIDPPNDFCWILTVDETQDDVWDYAYSLNNDWKGLVEDFEAPKGYYFNDFSVERNLTYERNPY